jgi:hypothetical protein
MKQVTEKEREETLDFPASIQFLQLSLQSYKREANHSTAMKMKHITIINIPYNLQLPSNMFRKTNYNLLP